MLYVVCRMCTVRCDCTIVPLSHCTTVPLYHCTTAPLYLRLTLFSSTPSTPHPPHPPPTPTGTHEGPRGHRNADAAGRGEKVRVMYDGHTVITVLYCMLPTPCFPRYTIHRTDLSSFFPLFLSPSLLFLGTSPPDAGSAHAPQGGQETAPWSTSPPSTPAPWVCPPSSHPCWRTVEMYVRATWWPRKTGMM
jgi:hypothetical protein